MGNSTPKPKRMSMVTYRNGRKTVIASIENDNVRRIAKHVDSIKDNNRKYVIVSNVIGNNLNSQHIILTGKVESITFTATRKMKIQIKL